MAKVSICLTVSKSCHAGKTSEETQALRSEHWEVGDTLEEAISHAHAWLASHREAIIVSCHAWRGSERVQLDIRSRKQEPGKRAVPIPKEARIIPAKVGDAIPAAICELIPGLSLSPAGFPLYHERRLLQRTDKPGTVYQLGTWHGVGIAVRKEGKGAYSWLIIRKPDKVPAHNVRGWHKQTHNGEAQIVTRRHKKPA